MLSHAPEACRQFCPLYARCEQNVAAATPVVEEIRDELGLPPEALAADIIMSLMQSAPDESFDAEQQTQALDTAKRVTNHAGFLRRELAVKWAANQVVKKAADSLEALNNLPGTCDQRPAIGRKFGIGSQVLRCTSSEYRGPTAPLTQQAQIALESVPFKSPITGREL